MLKRHPRQFLAWLCIAASLWMGVGFQLHGVAHSLHELEASSEHEPLPGHERACEQCLLFASADGALPLQAAALASSPPVLLANASPALALRVAAFTAYASRAPPSPS